MNIEAGSVGVYVLILIVKLTASLTISRKVYEQSSHDRGKIELAKDAAPLLPLSEPGAPHESLDLAHHALLGGFPRF